MSIDDVAIAVEHASTRIVGAIKDAFCLDEDTEFVSIPGVLKDLAISMERIADAVEAIQSSIESMGHK